MLSFIIEAVIVGIAALWLVVLVVMSITTKRKAKEALKGITVGISERLYAVFPDSKWRWVCRPVGFTTHGGIARIEVISNESKLRFIDVCYQSDGYMALHVLNVCELIASASEFSLENSVVSNTTKTVPTASTTGIKPHDRESVLKWYNIVLINSLNTLIDDLNAADKLCLYIGKDGKAYEDENDKHSVLYDFGELPDVTLWEHITEKLGEAGLLAEVQEENRIFISWA